MKEIIKAVEKIAIEISEHGAFERIDHQYDKNWYCGIR